MASEEHIKELLQAEKEGRLVVLPCRLRKPAYIIVEHMYACNICKHKDEAQEDPEPWGIKKCNMPIGRHCPFFVEEYIPVGYTIESEESGELILSEPGIWEGGELAELRGVDGICHSSKEEAQRLCDEFNKD